MWLPSAVVGLLLVDLWGTIVWNRYGLVKNPYVVQSPVSRTMWPLRVGIDAISILAVTAQWESLRGALWLDTILGSLFFARAAVVSAVGLLGVSLFSVARFLLRHLVILDGWLEFSVDYIRRSRESIGHGESRTLATGHFPHMFHRSAE